MTSHDTRADLARKRDLEDFSLIVVSLLGLSFSNPKIIDGWALKRTRPVKRVTSKVKAIPEIPAMATGLSVQEA